MTKDKQIIEHWINEVNEHGVNLTPWEISFMESITDQFSRREWISNKQEEILERIYADKTS